MSNLIEKIKGQKRAEELVPFRVGDTVKVKYIGLDKKGRMDFSIKDAIEG